MLAKVPTSVEELAQVSEKKGSDVWLPPCFYFRLLSFIRYRVQPPRHLKARTVPRARPRHISPTRAHKVPARGRGLGLHAPSYSLSRGVTMYSVPRDLRDALAEELDLEADRASAADTSSARTTRCWKCKSLPVLGIKLRRALRNSGLLQQAVSASRLGDTQAHVQDPSPVARKGAHRFRCAGRADKGFQSGHRGSSEGVS